MGDYRDVDREIDKLESMIPGGLFQVSKPNWKSIWNQVRRVGSSFKGTRYPTKEEHEQAWNRFQGLVAKVKCQQAEGQKNWERNKNESERLKNRIVSQAYSARPSSGLADGLLAIATGGISSVLNAIMGPFDERKMELQRSNELLKEGWDMLQRSKSEMLGRDKHAAFQALNDTKEILDDAWNAYKRQRQKAYEKYQHEREAKQQAWRRRTEENIRKLEDRCDRLNNVLSHKESHLSELYSKLSDARSDDFRTRVSGWIREEEDNIRDIRSKLSDVESWLYEAKSKLN